LKRELTRIKNIRATLASEKRRFGWYDDSRGLRYEPTGLYIKIDDFAGGLTYLRWFEKNFPDDTGRPDFLFEWTIILFKNGKLKEAEKKAFQAFCSNTYLFDIYFSRTIQHQEKFEHSNWETKEFADYCTYLRELPDLQDFSAWLDNYLATEKFKLLSIKFIDINKRLQTEKDQETRTYLFRHLGQLLDEYK
jgi:hypothetical protein